MSDIHRLGTWLRRFLCEHIVTERNLARNTQQSYRDAFTLLLPVSRGLANRGPPGRSRPQARAAVPGWRTTAAALRRPAISAWRQPSRDPVLEWCGRSVPSGPRKPRRPLVWLTKAETEALLNVRTEYAFLLRGTGLRGDARCAGELP